MACRLDGAKPLSEPMLEYCYIQWNINQNSCDFIQENSFENVLWEMAAILSWPQCVNVAWHDVTLAIQRTGLHNRHPLDSTNRQLSSCMSGYLQDHIDRLVQERRNSSALAMELRLSCTKPSISCHATTYYVTGPLYGESTGFPTQMTNNVMYYVSFVVSLNMLLNKQSSYQWFQASWS